MNNIKVIYAPEYVTNKNALSVFIAGGITNCPDWQQELLDYLDKSTINKNHYMFYNPRREFFDVSDPTQSEIQIKWEYNFLNESKILFFWFCKETMNPITLYELGKWANGSKEDKMLVVGCDPEYARKEDVKIQTTLARPNNFSYCENFEEFKKKCEAILNLNSSVSSWKYKMYSVEPKTSWRK